MSIERIFGALFSGAMCKLYACGFAVWIAYEVANELLYVAAKIGTGL